MNTSYVNSGTETENRFLQRLVLLLAALGIILLNFTDSKGASYQSTANGLWRNASTWGVWTSGVLTPATTIPGPADNVTIRTTVQIDSSQTCSNLYLGNGGIGTLEFITVKAGARGIILTVMQDVTVGANCTLRYNPSAVNVYRLRIGRNLTNGGTINLVSTINPANKTDLEFYYDAAPGNSNVTRSVGSSPSWNLGDVYVNKTTSTPLVDVYDNSFELGIKTLYATFGTYVHNNTGTYTVNAGTAYTIAPNMIFRVPMGNMNFSTSTDILTLQGKLEMIGGTVNVGSSAGLEGIRTDQVGTVIPWLYMTSGTLNINGGFTNLSTSAEPSMISMTGGTMNLNIGTTGCSREVLKVYDIAGSRFDMSGGTIILRKPNTTATYTTPDVYLCGANINNTVTGGTIRFGNGAITKGFTFYPFYSGNFSKTYPNMWVASTAPAGSYTLAPVSGNNSSFCFYSLTVDNTAYFNMTPWNMASTSSTLYLTGVNTSAPSYSLSLDGTFNTSNSTVSFNGTVRQYAGSPLGNTPTLYNLSISNSNHVELRSNLNLSNYLSMNLGNLVTYYNYAYSPATTTQHKLLTCLANCTTNAGAANSYVDGPLVHTIVAPNATTDVAKYWPIGKGGSFRPMAVNLRHNNTNSNTYMAEVINSAACVAPTLVPATLQGVSRVRYYQFWKTGGVNFTSGNMRIYYGTDDGITDPASAMIGENNYNYNNCSTLISGGSTTWIPYGNSVTSTNFGPAQSMPFVQKCLDNWRAFRSPSGLSNYQPSFALANPPGGANALPISLMEFDAKMSSGKVNVTWTTQVEINNDFFTIERSRDNNTYETIGFVQGAGNSNEIRRYSYTDMQPHYGISFYRLRQTDYDGHSECFASVPVSNRKKGFTVYPNPCTKPVVNVSVDNDRLADYTFSVRDMVGREIPFKAGTGSNGDIQITLDESAVSHGSFYILYANDGVETVQQKLVIQ